MYGTAYQAPVYHISSTYVLHIKHLCIAYQAPSSKDSFDTINSLPRSPLPPPQNLKCCHVGTIQYMHELFGARYRNTFLRNAEGYLSAQLSTSHSPTIGSSLRSLCIMPCSVAIHQGSKTMKRSITTYTLTAAVPMVTSCHTPVSAIRCPFSTILYNCTCIYYMCDIPWFRPPMDCNATQQHRPRSKVNKSITLSGSPMEVTPPPPVCWRFWSLVLQTLGM